MNVLILTAKFGMGHLSAAEAIKEEVELTNNRGYVVDVIEYLFPSWSKTIYSGFNQMTSKFASLYNLLNKTAGNHDTKIPLKKVFVKKIDNLIEKYNADIIISTMPVSSKYISMYKSTKGSDIPLYTYITDVTAHNEWLGNETDIYVVASKETKEELILKGVDENKIQICGIPVKQNFKKKYELKSDKREYKRLLIMGGGLGLIPGIENILKELTGKKDIRITLICGKNREMYDKIKSRFPMINVVGFTDKVYEYMKDSDLIITKSGGVTTFEAIHTLTPMYIIHPFLMQEVGNAKYIQKNNIGRISWNKKEDILKGISELIDDENTLEQMKRNMQRIKREVNNDFLKVKIGA